MKKNLPENSFVIKKVSEGKVYLSGVGEVVLPEALLPKTLNVGDDVNITLTDPNDENEVNKTTAREILNEILKPKK